MLIDNGMNILPESLGHQVRVTHDPAQALEAVDDGPLDFFILDIGLPGMDGYALARLLRACQHHGRDVHRAHGQLREKAGFEHYLVKPADLAQLMRLLERPPP